MLDGLVAFLAVSAVVICTPGQDTALTVRNTLAGGRRSGIATAGGVAVGQFAWTLAASAGIVALLSASEPVFQALRLVGAAYLVYLGAQSLLAAVRRRPAETRRTQTGQPLGPAALFVRASSATSGTRRWPSSSRACCRSSRPRVERRSSCCSHSASCSAR